MSEPSRRILVRDAVIAALNADLPSNIPEAGKRRWLPGTPLAETRIAVYFTKEANTLPQQRLSKISHRGLMLGIQFAVPTVDIEEADDIMEPLLVHATNRLCDSTLDNLATSIEEVEVDWEVNVADIIYATATLFIQVNYQTLRGDLTRKA